MTAPPTTQPSITIVKRFSYRGHDEEWSNHYSLDGDVPENEGQWHTLADAIIVSEKRCYTDETSVVRAYGYEAGTVASVAQIDYEGLGGTLVVGTLSPSGSAAIAGDQAAWVRAHIGNNSHGKKVYVRKYFHGGRSETGSPDDVATQWKANMLLHAATMLGGTLPGDMVWVGPGGQTPVTAKAGPYMTTRTLKRRGKRP